MEDPVLKRLVYAKIAAMKITEKQAAADCGVAVNTLAGLSKGKEGTSKRKLRLISQGLNIPMRDLLLARLADDGVVLDDADPEFVQLETLIRRLPAVKRRSAIGLLKVLLSE